MTWGDRWRALVDDTSPQTALRAGRGRVYERSGRVTDLRPAPGLLTARVQGSRATPYLVEIGLPVLDDSEWEAVLGAVAEQARYAARLLAGQAPEGLSDELASRGLRLFPHPAELSTSCACEDPRPMCKHVVAVIEALARRLDTDPFALLHLRGRGRERFLADLATVRAGGEQAERGLPMSALSGADWTALRAPLDGVEAAPAADDPLTRLGDPPGWTGGVSAADLFRPLVRRGAAWAAERLAETGR
jgi:uncharacterized Zn finger protein